jgi:hypothetical protein
MIPRLVGQLYAIVNELEGLFPGRKFTPDGHLVGSLGEVIAAYEYELALLRASARGHDATDAAGRQIQIKATQGRSVALRSQPDFLIVLKLNRDGSSTEVYNGPGEPAWIAAGNMQKNGQRPVSLSTLVLLAGEVEEADKILRRII